MLIDRIDRQSLRNVLPGDIGEIFYIDETVFDFVCKSHMRFPDMKECVLPQLLPYDNFILHFRECLLTIAYLQNDSRFIAIRIDSIGIFRNGTVFCLHKNMNSAVYCLFNGQTLACKGVGLIRKKDDGLKILSVEEQEALVKEGIPLFIYAEMLHRFLSILSCKNIDVKKVEPPEKLQKRRAKKHKKPLVSYRILKLKKVTKKYSANGDGEGVWSNRIHLCRGHMREYTDDRPLFGKLVGRYWIPPHARGNRKMGIVQKDYALNT